MSAQDAPVAKKLTKADFVSDQTVRWCPGCGDYSILANVQKIMPDLGVPRENIVFISGIGCSSRFPYYMDTYGFHTVHGRAPAVVTGLKVANPELSVWMITGDGDALSIGGNHLLHILRRNLDVNILLFNNRIYGLTKGQYSPTSEPGKITKSSPVGSLEEPINPVKFALAAEATFVARTLDVDPKGMQATLKAASQHKGVSLIEIYQNCNIFNDGAYTHIIDRSVRDERMITLEAGKPLVFGKERDKGIRLNGLRPEVVTLGDGISEEDLLIHDPSDAAMAYLLSTMDFPDFPVPMGVIRQSERSTYEEGVEFQVKAEIEKKGLGDLENLLNTGDCWDIDQVVTSAGDPDEAQEENEIIEEQVVAEEDTSFIHDLMSDKIEALTLKQIAHLSPDSSIADAISEMRNKNHGCVLVVSDKKLLGIFTEGDLLVKIIGKGIDLKQATVSEYMTKAPTTLNLDDSVAVAFNMMSVGGFHHLPVIGDNESPVGFLSSRDLLEYVTGHVGSGME